MKRILAYLVLFLVFIFTFGCSGGNDKPSGNDIKTTETSVPEFSPKDFFPTEIGTRWAYKITLGKIDPLMTKIVNWPIDKERSISAKTIGYYMGAINSKPGKTFDLILSVKCDAPKQGPLQYPESVELKVEKDDLGVYYENNGLFWAITESGRYMVTEVTTYPSTSIGAPTTSGWGSWGNDGHSMQVHFFGDRPGIGIGLGASDDKESSADVLIFEGFEKDSMHFVRKVTASELKPGEEDDKLNQSFTEEMWFVRGKGLVRLEQKIGNQVSMTWELVDFKQG